MVAEPIIVTDPDDPRLDDFRDLTTADRGPTVRAAAAW